MASFDNRKPGHKGNRNTGVNLKQTRRSFNLESKLKVIELLEKGNSAAKLGRCLGVAESSIRTIGKNKDKIKKCALASQNYAGTKYRIRYVDLVSMESLLLLWIEDQVERQVILSSCMIRKRAVEIYHYLSKGRTNDRAKFVASISWYEKFRERYNMNSKVTGHAAFDVYHQVANVRLANLFIVDVNDFIESEQYRRDQIFCIKETKLFWKKIPGTDFFKPALDRIVLILSSNMAANFKCKPTAIFSMGRHNFDKLHHNDCECCDLPVNWYAKATTWMNSAMFQEWIEKLFVPEVKSYCERLNIPFKILLLLDKTPSHQELPEIPNVNIMYLPSNTESITNPMNHGIISEFQICYLKMMLEALFEVIDTGFHKSLKGVWNNFGENDAIDLIGQSWNGISETTMKEAWTYISGKEEDIQSRESRMTARIESCLQLLEKLLGGFVDLGKTDILAFLESHDQEVSNEELADLRNMVPSVPNELLHEDFCEDVFPCGRKMKARGELPQGIDRRQNLHNIADKKSKANSENDEESNEYIDPTYEVECSSSETIDVDIVEAQNEHEEAITGRMDLEPVDLELIDIKESDDKSENSVGYPIEDEEIMEYQIKEESETQHKFRLYNQVSDEGSKESLGRNCQSESPSDMFAMSDEESQTQSKRIQLSGLNDVTWKQEDLEQAKIAVSDEESQLLFEPLTKDEENSFKKENEADLDFGGVGKMEDGVDIESNDNPVEASTSTPEVLTIAQLQRLVRLSYRLIAESRENDDNPARREQFIADVENAMQPYNRSLDLKLGGDELW